VIKKNEALKANFRSEQIAGIQEEPEVCECKQPSTLKTLDFFNVDLNSPAKNTKELPNDAAMTGFKKANPATTQLDRMAKFSSLQP